jgi:hypothetical protein
MSEKKRVSELMALERLTGSDMQPTTKHMVQHPIAPPRKRLRRPIMSMREASMTVQASATRLDISGSPIQG